MTRRPPRDASHLSRMPTANRRRPAEPERVSKKAYEARIGQIRERLVQLQVELKQQPFGVLLIVAGVAGAGHTRDDEEDAEGLLLQLHLELDEAFADLADASLVGLFGYAFGFGGTSAISGGHS